MSTNEWEPGQIRPVEAQGLMQVVEYDPNAFGGAAVLMRWHGWSRAAEKLFNSMWFHTERIGAPVGAAEVRAERQRDRARDVMCTSHGCWCRDIAP